MRQPHTFLITVLLDDHDTTTLRGRVRFIASGEETSFVGINELVPFIRLQIEKFENALEQNDSPAPNPGAAKE
jgi:hypothetical protein